MLSIILFVNYERVVLYRKRYNIFSFFIVRKNAALNILFFVRNKRSNTAIIASLTGKNQFDINNRKILSSLGHFVACPCN